MNAKGWTYGDRSGWGAGPWTDEPEDKVEWRDKATGYPCIARRGTMGAWCGYVAVGPEHSYFGWDCRTLPDPDVEVHGGLTYSAACDEEGGEHSICHVPLPGESEKVWWLGFDCSHGGDYSPGMWGLLSASFDPGTRRRRFRGGYWTLDEVRRECEHLAEQLKETEKPPAEAGGVRRRRRC